MSASTAPSRAVRVCLVGNPNVGKSSLFNQLTGLRQRIGNFPGCTVERKHGVARAGATELMVIDLPGTYSLVPDSPDEMIVRDVLHGRVEDRPDVVVCVLDAGNLRRGLFFLSECLDLGVPVVCAVNMLDEARRAGLLIDIPGLCKAAGCTVIGTVGRTGEGVPALIAATAEAAVAPHKPARPWCLADEDEKVYATRLDQAEERAVVLEEIRAEDPVFRDREIEARYRWSHTVVGREVESAIAARRRSDRIDRFALHPVLGPVLFGVVMGLLFQAIFAWATPLMDVIGAVVAWAQAGLRGPSLLSGLLADGVVAGVGNVLVFLPQIVILFLVLGVLEDSGYLPRGAFIVDRPLKGLGLSGRAFIPLLGSFACAIPGIMAARTIPSRRERLVTIFIAPLMTCSARLPVYTLLIAAVVPNRRVLGILNVQGLVLLALYLGGMFSGALVAVTIDRLRRRRNVLPSVMELPPYRLPVVSSLLIKLWQRVGAFLTRAGTTILLASVVLWAAATFPRVTPAPGTPPDEARALQLESSVAGRLGHTIEPLIRPLGLDWKIGIGLVGSFAAREVFVSTMGVVYAVGDDVDEGSSLLRDVMRRERWPDTGAPIYTLPATLGLLAFYVLALQCVSTIAVVRKETGSRWFATMQVSAFTGFAWLAAFITYHGARLVGL